MGDNDDDDNDDPATKLISKIQHQQYESLEELKRAVRWQQQVANVSLSAARGEEHVSRLVGIADEKTSLPGMLGRLWGGGGYRCFCFENTGIVPKY